MIVFDLKCAANGHVFEAWFGSSEDYEDQQSRAMVRCPICDSPSVEKAAMAPRVNAKGGGEALASDTEVKSMLAAMAAAQKKVLAGSEYVGPRFADEARAIHVGDADSRSIHGQASAEQAKGLIEDGIAVAPLPFPVIEPGREN